MTIQNLSDLDLTTKLGELNHVHMQISSKYKLTLQAKDRKKKRNIRTEVK